MSTQSEINRIKNAKTAIASAITAKGVSVPSGTKIDGMPSLIASISQGEDLTDEIATQDSLISQIQTALADKVAPTPDSGGGGGGGIETCDINFSANIYTAANVFYCTVADNGSIEVLNSSMRGASDYNDRLKVVKNSMIIIECAENPPSDYNFSNWQNANIPYTTSNFSLCLFITGEVTTIPLDLW